MRVPAQELHIDAIRAGNHYLRTSPEFHMKRLLAEGSGSIFQIGPCFRDGEKGRFHNPEFTMLEWYTVGADYLDAARETAELIRHTAGRICCRNQLRWKDRTIDLTAEWQAVTVSDLFRTHAGWNPVESYDEDRFTLDLLEKVEPSLTSDPIIMKDYPCEASAFARIRGCIAERWELYIGGIELANAYSELTDAQEQRGRLETIARQRAALGKEVYPQDEEFLAAMERGLPECAGVALGIDRLLMLLGGYTSIQDVI